MNTGPLFSVHICTDVSWYLHLTSVTRITTDVVNLIKSTFIVVHTYFQLYKKNEFLRSSSDKVSIKSPSYYSSKTRPKRCHKKQLKKYQRNTNRLLWRWGSYHKILLVRVSVLTSSTLHSKKEYVGRKKFLPFTKGPQGSYKEEVTVTDLVLEYKNYIVVLYDSLTQNP